MFELNDARRLYWLVDELLAGHISVPFFCNQFYYCFDLELNLSELSSVERMHFSHISEVAGRVSVFDEDIRNFPNAYATEKELLSAVADAAAAMEKCRRA